MSEKLTYRDILVYTLNGMIGLILIGIIYRSEISCYIFEIEIKNSEFILLALIPVCYLIGHIVLSIDNFIFMRLLRKLRENLFNAKCSFPKKIHNWIFGYRIVGVKEIKWINYKEDFGLICTKLRNEGLFNHADSYFVLSDFFKGLIITEFFVIVLSCLKSDWYYLSISIILLIIFYFRARKYSNQYVNEIINQSKLIGL